MEERIKNEANNKITIIVSDFNAKIGSRPTKDGKHVRALGLRERNDQGKRLLEFVKERKLMISNMCFKMSQRRLYTWKSSNAQTRSQVSHFIHNNFNHDYVVYSR